jgi:hypothetical protein
MLATFQGRQEAKRPFMLSLSLFSSFTLGYLYSFSSFCPTVDGRDISAGFLRVGLLFLTIILNLQQRWEAAPRNRAAISKGASHPCAEALLRQWSRRSLQIFSYL